MKTDDTLYIRWSKREEDLLYQYPNRNGKHLGYAISNTISEAIKTYASDYDITSVKVQIKLKKD